MITKVTYCSMDGDPAILSHHSDGRILGFVCINDIWKKAHAADISTEAVVMSEDKFKGRWPGLKLPNLSK